jgi:HEAT repeat protein
VRWRLAAPLRAAHLGDARVEAALVALAADPRPIVRLEAVDALGLLRPPRAAAVDDALRAACDDPDGRTVASALVGLARAGAHLPADPLARALAPERMATVPAPAAERLLVALAVARRPEAGATLRNLSLLWKPRDPVLVRALAAAVAACGPGTRRPLTAAR